MIPCSLPPVKRKIKIVFSQYIFIINTIIFFFYESNIFYSYIILLFLHPLRALFANNQVLQKHIQNLFYFLFHIIFTRYLLMIHFLEMMYDTQNDLEFCLCNLIFFSFFSFCYSNTKLSGFNPKLYIFFSRSF